MKEKEFTQSFFRFEITQTTKVLMYKIHISDGKCWNINGEEERGHIAFMEIDCPMNNMLVILGRGYMRIITACSGYEYLIQDKDEGDGAEVIFSGSVNALQAQTLMPRMRYVPGTLQGMSEDMNDYAPITEFMQIHAEHNAGSPNPQDTYGWRVNMKFNNELVPYFPPFEGEMREKPKKRCRCKQGSKFNRY